MSYTVAQYDSVKAREAINRRLYNNNQSFVETAIYRVCRNGDLSRL
ncbi:hypothetical protein GXM_00024 [Nostoc sphaeroides CCNUC1]|uniref:Uncharacterized protein n=1 Tax=Nostoc sphaeroides CCNUC1 TaxID=2653204 RepID=A0A5P8VQK9_9NOSO|nr:hypothetical protein GXM_00024 [Nostoc sphaeroides CCNUC1]